MGIMVLCPPFPNKEQDTGPIILGIIILQKIRYTAFGLTQDPLGDPYHFSFIMVNYSKYPVKCWCNLNATTSGESLKYEGFYSGIESRLLQPNAIRNGHFRINDLLRDSKYTIESLKNEANDENFKRLLHLNIEFRYCSLIDGIISLR